MDFIIAVLLNTCLISCPDDGAILNIQDHKDHNYTVVLEASNDPGTTTEKPDTRPVEIVIVRKINGDQVEVIHKAGDDTKRNIVVIDDIEY